ncbi:MAG: hydrogenase maturation protease [Proteobacteria bacterium]|nr:hydrogenase maturation protease [Pseudomonadota bacterium]MBU1582735.1 hydrogenase maturation protease [Pseudomonadota bacterium]MBU2451847.1 hydrogenase maturation protease [Pseudomonadota bacterium]MBU2631860.1 hydrogenase maturation protease [Pseudomonadota bacterium]
MNDGNNKVRVICCGNPFRGDDAVGLEVFKHLEKEFFSDRVEIIEGGILGINLLPLFHGCSTLIFVDSVLMDETPGHIQWFTLAEILETAPARISSHEINPSQLMTLWHQLNPEAVLPDILLLGIVVSDPVHLTDTISPPIKPSVIKAAHEIKNRIRSLVTHAN